MTYNVFSGTLNLTQLILKRFTLKHVHRNRYSVAVVAVVVAAAAAAAATRHSMSQVIVSSGGFHRLVSAVAIYLTR